MYLSGEQCMTIRQRWIFAVMCFFGLIHLFALTSCLPITMTEMVVETEIFTDSTCPSDIKFDKKMNSTGKVSYFGEKYDWSEYTQGIILSSFYYGFMITHIPGGLLAEKYGGKHILGFGILIASICTLLIPITVIHADSVGLIILRFLIGLAEGVVYPAVNTMLSQWVPPDERSRIGSFVYSGEILGTVYGNYAGGMILYYTGDWTSVFYLIGSTSIIWYLLWLVLCYNNPREHPYIYQLEADFLNEKISEHRHDEPESVPWLHVLKSKPMWATIMASIGFLWIDVTILIYLPKYLSSVLRISVQENGYLNSIVCICMWISSISVSWPADILVVKQYMSRTNARKLGVVISLFGSACFIVAASYSGCSPILVTVMFSISMILLANGYSCILINTLDISPNYAGTLMAISNAISCGLAGSLSPYVISIVAPNQTLIEWQLVFWLLMIISTCATVVYLYFGSADVQYWNDLKILDNDSINFENEKGISCEMKDIVVSE